MKRLYTEKEFDFEVDSLPYIFGWLDGSVAFLSLPSMSYRLALEEAIVNVRTYAYPQGRGGVHISVQIFLEEKVVWEVRDQGLPFDPTKSSQEVSKMSPTKEGGFGLLLLEKYMDQVEYFRQGGDNVLQLTLFLRH